MKVTLSFLLVATAYIASAVPIEDKVSAFKYPRYIQFPDGEGKLHEVDLAAEPNMEAVEMARDPANNLYLLFTRQNPQNPQTLVMNNANSIQSSNFNPNVPTVVISHGWLSSQDTDINPVIRNAYLRKSDVNVIVLDWRRLALMDYVTAVYGVPGVGRGLGQFLSFVNSVTGAPFNSMHLIGFSLGAHLVGNAGRELGGRVARITALDPAGPLWSFNNYRVNARDGIYVEAIHTDGGYANSGLGIGTAIVQADFFPNGGITQPGCISNYCNHNRAWEFFAATVSYNHMIGNECTNMMQVSFNSCRGGQLHMGNDYLRKIGTGMYRVNTGRTYPF